MLPRRNDRTVCRVTRRSSAITCWQPHQHTAKRSWPATPIGRPWPRIPVLLAALRVGNPPRRTRRRRPSKPTGNSRRRYQLPCRRPPISRGQLTPRVFPDRGSTQPHRRYTRPEPLIVHATPPCTKQTPPARPARTTERLGVLWVHAETCSPRSTQSTFRVDSVARCSLRHASIQSARSGPLRRQRLALPSLSQPQPQRPSLISTPLDLPSPRGGL